MSQKFKEQNWQFWGPYLSERSWGSVREDYSPDGQAWEYFPFEHAQSRAYRWGEDGIAGICDRDQFICFAPTFWNGTDSILKERLFGLANKQGNHGEDVKEAYFYLDNTPDHSYMKFHYKYPINAFPYQQLIENNQQSSTHDSEYEIYDTGIFDDDQYFNIDIEYAKKSPQDIFISISATNQSQTAASLWVLPTIWFRNTWGWGQTNVPSGSSSTKPQVKKISDCVLKLTHPNLGIYRLYFEKDHQLAFTENETNYQKLFGSPNSSKFTKDAFHELLINTNSSTVNSKMFGTKAAQVAKLNLEPKQTQTLRLRLSRHTIEHPFHDFDQTFKEKKDQSDQLFNSLVPKTSSDQHRTIVSQALSGMLWTKQFYYYDVRRWLKGDPNMPKPPRSRKSGRNASWKHIKNFDIISVPDKWEYPWYAAWDLAFHCVPLALIDPTFAKQQLLLLTREWYMHPNGQLPAFEWDFSSANPPVHAWAAWQVYQLDGGKDRQFLESIYLKLLINFTWWINRQDPSGKNIFQGGFLGLDNIGVIDRNQVESHGGHLDQADSTSWMAAYCLHMFTITLELARDNPAYEDLATKFFEHFLSIASSVGKFGKKRVNLWDEQDGFYYDELHLHDDTIIPLKVRSIVGLLPILATTILEPDVLEKLPNFKNRIEQLLDNVPNLANNIASCDLQGVGKRRLLALVNRDRLVRILEKMLSQDEFLSPFGIRSLSKFHKDNPFTFSNYGQEHTISYEPGESQTLMFGGNSNWRGPIWFPINYMLIDSLKTLHKYYGDGFKVSCPTGSKTRMTLSEISEELKNRLIKIFIPDESSVCAVHNHHKIFNTKDDFKDLKLFYEYFHPETGQGLGASHQTGWTGLIANLICSNQHT